MVCKIIIIVTLLIVAGMLIYELRPGGPDDIPGGIQNALIAAMSLIIAAVPVSVHRFITMTMRDG
jgi:cytochrome b subunit of formate dehydrogenase